MTTKPKSRKKIPSPKKVTLKTKGIEKGRKETDYFYTNKRQYSAIQSYKHEREKKELLTEMLKNLEELANSPDLKTSARAEKKIQKLEGRIEKNNKRLRDKRTRLNNVLEKITTRVYDKKGKRLESETFKKLKLTKEQKEAQLNPAPKQNKTKKQKLIFKNPTMVVFMIVGAADGRVDYGFVTDVAYLKMRVPAGYDIEKYIEERYQVLFEQNPDAFVEVVSIQIITSKQPKAIKKVTRKSNRK